MAALVGAPLKLKVNVLAGISASDAVAVKDTSVPGRTILLGIAASVGGLFSSRTVMVNVRRSSSPLLVTRTTMSFVLGPWASVGVQEKTPVAGSTVAPVGAFSKLYISWPPGVALVAVTVRLTFLPSTTD